MFQPIFSATLAPVGAFLIFCGMWFIAYWGTRLRGTGRKILLDCYLVMLVGFLTELVVGWFVFIVFYNPDNLLPNLYGMLFFVTLWSIGPWIDILIQVYTLRKRGD